MKNWTKPIFTMAFLVLALSACGERAPVAWNANLDISCKPHDLLDQGYAKISPKKFWREQEYDLGTMLKAGQKNIEMSSSILDDSRAQKGEFFSKAQALANKRGLTGKAKRDHVKENMDNYDREVKDIAERINTQKIALTWVNKCQKSVEVELRRLKLAPVKYDPEKRPR